MMLLMLIMIRLLSNAAVEYDIRQDLKYSVFRNARNVSVDNRKILVDENFIYKEDNIYYLVIKKKGKVLYGNYPSEVEEEMKMFPIRRNSTRTLVVSGEKWFVRDVRIGIPGEKKVFVRGIIRKADADSQYRTIELWAYLCVIGVSFVILACEWIFARHISGELKGMCDTAEGIGKNLDMSRRMTYEGRFEEIAVLAEANNRMLDRMEETFLQQEQFTSDVAHELRTPVAVMLAECQYAENKRNPEEYEEVLEVVHRQSKKINTIISQLLNFSRLDQNREQIVMEKIDLADIVEVICEEQQEKNEKEISLELQTKEAVAMGDINLISIVIQNLISNAIKFSHEKGTIEIRTGEEAGWLYVSVTDHGIGIEQENLERIFRRFYKCDESRNAEGFGLGLPLSVKIAEKHGGNISVTSTIGKGSTFILHLPKF
ncbi:MAG: HAMP domain-containing histidine kinase [Lachnospiraceae bacterium]|nr:HAMP domain-containing histidine kinase [Lachnospiraceae bacterium]